MRLGVLAAVTLIIFGANHFPLEADADGTVPQSKAATPFDFNGDGYADLAAGAPFRSVGGANSAGSIDIVFGSPVGLSTDGAQFLTQNSPGIAGQASAEAYFGQSITSGDFDGDGFADLATRAGAEIVAIYGGPFGLTARSREFELEGFDLPELSLNGPPMATGDLNTDGFDDLVVSSPGNEDLLGAIVILPGSGVGLTSSSAVPISPNAPGVPGKGHLDDFFGDAVAVGDVTGDGHDDLALTSAGEAVSAGLIYLFEGSADGIRVGEATIIRGEEILAPSEPVHLGSNNPMTIADFDMDGFGDLAIGIPQQCLTRVNDDCGGVLVLPGTSSGFAARHRQVFAPGLHRLRPAIGDEPYFGATLAAGNLDEDTHPDLVIGSPSETVAGIANAGIITILRGTASGLTDFGAQIWSQNTPQVKGVPRTDDYFADGPVRILDFGKGHHADLAVHSPDDRLRTRATTPRTGTINVFYTTSEGVTATDQLWHSNSPALANRTRTSSEYGSD